MRTSLLLMLAIPVAGCDGQVGAQHHADAGPGVGDADGSQRADGAASSDASQPWDDAASPSPDGGPSPCAGVTCSDHGTCAEMAGHATCTCDADYHADGLTCVADAALPTSCAPAPMSELVVDVRDRGATGDGATDDTAAIQAAVDEVAETGGTVLVPDGTYRIDALTSVQLGSNMTFRMSRGAVLEAIPNAEAGYVIVKIEAASDVNVVGGTLQGEREDHTGADGEWGMGVALYGATRAVVEGVTARDCWGDGFYVDYGTTDATFCSVVADGNRRQGMSIVSANGVVIQDSVFQNTGGTSPQCGIDIEPDDGDVVRNVQILRSRFLDNDSQGIKLYDHRECIFDVTIDGNTVTGNNGALSIQATSGHRITNNTIVDDWMGIGLAGSTDIVVTGNTITAANPIMDDSGGNTIEDNVFP